MARTIAVRRTSAPPSRLPTEGVSVMDAPDDVAVLEAMSISEMQWVDWSSPLVQAERGSE